VFDVIQYGGADIWREPFARRHEALLEFENAIGAAGVATVRVKKYYRLLAKNYQQLILDLYKEKKPYLKDGIIFTEISQDYNQTVNLKWKPPALLTIDFLAVKTQGARYLLMAGVDPAAFKRFGLTLPADYEGLVKSTTAKVDISDKLYSKYFPAPFESSLIKDSQYYTPGKKIPNLHGHIVEMSYEGKWVFHRIRTDRDVELSNGTYFGNNYKVAELTLQASLNPLTIGDLCSSYGELTLGFYFQKKDDAYLFVRKFNNYVKNVLIARHRADQVMDMASGKGQDIKKYVDAKVKELLMIELDNDAIDELIKRKFDIIGKMYIDDIYAPVDLRTYKPQGCKLSVRQLDLNNSHKKNIEVLGAGKFKLIVCNFALHYMLNDKKGAENIVAFVANYLDDDGEFIFTALDGEKVFELVKGGKWVKDKYLIELVRPAKSPFKGYEKIKVLLPCADTPYEEPLINLLELDKAFKRHGIYRTEGRNFDVFLGPYAQKKPHMHKELNDHDKFFIGLYRFSIYKKTGL
jgi:hypothetical protein